MLTKLYILALPMLLTGCGLIWTFGYSPPANFTLSLQQAPAPTTSSIHVFDQPSTQRAK